MLSAIRTSHSPFGIDQNARFIQLSSLLAELAKKEDLEILPFIDPSLPHFSALTDSGRHHVLWRLETLTTIAERLQKQGVKIAKSRALVWAFFSHMKLRPPADLQDRVDDDQEAIDIYNDAHQLIFANLTFFRVVSYSLEDLYCRPWMELFDRDRPEIHEQLFKIVSDMLKGGTRIAVDAAQTIPQHLVTESSSPLRVSALVSTKTLAPLTGKDNRVEAYMAIHKIRVLSPFHRQEDKTIH